LGGLAALEEGWAAARIFAAAKSAKTRAAEVSIRTSFAYFSCTLLVLVLRDLV
jgi:hypothetical protein